MTIYLSKIDKHHLLMPMKQEGGKMESMGTSGVFLQKKSTILSTEKVEVKLQLKRLSELIQKNLMAY